jgi:hypothetical protein
MLHSWCCLITFFSFVVDTKLADNVLYNSCHGAQYAKKCLVSSTQPESERAFFEVTYGRMYQEQTLFCRFPLFSRVRVFNY